MSEQDELGLDGLRKRYGFKASRNVHLYFEGRGPYEARSLIASAFMKFNPDAKPLVPADFTGGNAHIFLAREFNFEMRDIKTGKIHQPPGKRHSLRTNLRKISV